MKARDPLETWEYVLVAERERVPTGKTIVVDGKEVAETAPGDPLPGATVFVLGYLTAAEESLLFGAVTSETKTREQMIYDSIRPVLIRGLRGWRGLSNNNGVEMPFRLQEGTKLCHESNLDLLPFGARRELANEIMRCSSLSPAEGN